ncbi:MAG: 2-succinyl-5-enolpyruvyl-6-hydroxy-3-cyclohexene-1-carboxylic-acid synthase [Candidatus Lumbricidophila eiseniae]|uniref:2-succinyl-5-enolpyruvyl-6-hydroxy-3-cyclohexene-1-carboxylate synthase n=1 Tax=Candidatus Lumbricidiphila eiseniae TaxID=1969409 RepID=A0A2A6FUM9_9MICO|nr:MAG: 2-succinyl-5-enolpyruvyl-6-hydroxy-3-cyclohexene-1-carboxylic-acid synthase [Candidatus Lumbricidophila eiseniae]
MTEPTMSPAQEFADALIAGFIAAGVQHVVVAPGSRSQALALAAVEAQRAGTVCVHVRIDERGAGFFALGLAVESRIPAVVIVTSGTAVANLHPAVLEAHHAGVPLIVLSADRPAQLRGIRSNQTTKQPGMFQSEVRREWDIPTPDGAAHEVTAAEGYAVAAVAAARGLAEDRPVCPTPGPGPVHVNVQLGEPLSGARLRGWSWPALQSLLPPHAGATEETATISRAPGTVVIAGAGAGAAAEEFARTGGWPLIAEVTSGARFGPNLVPGYREVLADDALVTSVQRVVVFGHPTLSREIPQLIQRPGVESIVVAENGVEWYNPGRRVVRFERAVTTEGHPLDDAERDWLRRWLAAGRAVVDLENPVRPGLRSGVDETGHVTDFAAQRAYVRAQLDTLREPLDRRMLVTAVWATSWPHDRLVWGASRLIREADRVVSGRRIPSHANRGLAGIDGTVATALGIAVASGAVTRVVLGDLALLHDAGSLLLGDAEPRPRVLVIVGNDGGGTIFDTLATPAPIDTEAFDRVMYTPQRVDFAALATAYDWEFARATNRGELVEQLALPITGPRILEIPLAR